MNTNNNQINETKNLGKLPVWDLKDLYPSQKDKRLKRDLNIIKNETSIPCLLHRFKASK